MELRTYGEKNSFSLFADLSIGRHAPFCRPPCLSLSRTALSIRFETDGCIPIARSKRRFRKLATERSYVWYGIAAQRGAEKDKLIEEMGKAGWTFLQQEGSGYFFQQGTEKIVITSRMWSGDFVLFKAPVTDHPLSLSNE